MNASVIVVGLEGSPADEWLIRYAAHLDGIDLSARMSRAASPEKMAGPHNPQPA